jgi:hypothetical protein
MSYACSQLKKLKILKKKTVLTCFSQSGESTLVYDRQLLSTFALVFFLVGDCDCHCRTSGSGSAKKNYTRSKYKVRNKAKI